MEVRSQVDSGPHVELSIPGSIAYDLSAPFEVITSGNGQRKRE
jgi:hypothetical protein